MIGSKRATATAWTVVSYKQKNLKIVKKWRKNDKLRLRFGKQTVENSGLLNKSHPKNFSNDNPDFA